MLLAGQASELHQEEEASTHISYVNADRAQHMHVMETLPGPIANFNSDKYLNNESTR